MSETKDESSKPSLPNQAQPVVSVSDQLIQEIPSDTPMELEVSLVRRTAKKIAARLFPDDSNSVRDDRLREAVVIFFSRSAQRVAESATGVVFNNNIISIMEQVQIIRQAMAFIQRYVGLTGQEKKKIVITAVTNTVLKFKPDMSQLEIDDVTALAASIIELAMDVKHGRLDIGQLSVVAADVAVTSCLNGWCVPKSKNN